MLANQWTIEAMVGVAVVGYVAIHFFLRRRARNLCTAWPSARATIQAAHPGSYNLGRALIWFVRVSYSFEVNGNYFSGYTDRRVTSETAGLEYARWCQGRTFPIRYNPSTPDTNQILDSEWINEMDYPEAVRSDSSGQ